MVFRNFKTISLAILWVVTLSCNQVQGQGLFDSFLSTNSSKSNSSKSNSKPSSSSGKKTPAAAPSKSEPSLSDLFSSKTPQEKAKEDAARKKAADAKAKLDARNKAIAAAEKKKADELKAREQATREKAKEQVRAAELAQKQKEEAMAALQKKKADEQKARELAAREKQKAIEKAAELAEKQKADAEKARRAAEEEKAEAARKLALAEMRQKEEKARQLLAAAREREAAMRAAEEEKLRVQREADAALLAHAHGKTANRPFGGLFGSRSRTNVVAVQKPQGVSSPPNRYLYINEREISRLNPANSRLEIDLGDQRARVYRGSVLVIETQISTGKPGFSTPTGRFIVQEKLVEKKSGRYGTWYDGSGNELRGDDSFDPPPGGVQFVGADMPYWLRLTDGIGMHIGFVPDGPASHGCIRVPSNVQPLIYSKVGIGTPVSVRG